MLYCEKCNLTVSGHPAYCPLCQGKLTGRPEQADAYPPLVYHPDYLGLALRIAAIISIAAVCICGIVSYSVTDSLRGWWLYVAGAAASFWAIFGMAYSRRRNVSKSILFTTVVICLVALGWDLCTGYSGWSLDFVLPIACCAAMLTMPIIAKIRKLHIEQYIYYLILDIIFGIIPLVLLLCRVIRTVTPSVVCVGISVISLAALLLFEGRALRAEIVRRTHL